MEENKGKGLNLGLDLSLTPGTLISNINWCDLPFRVSIGEVELSLLSQQKHFLELVYDHQSVFSLCDEDFRSLPLTQAYHSNYDYETHLLATPYDSSSVAN